MSCRHGYTLLAISVGLLAQLGCANGRLGWPTTDIVMSPNQPAGRTSSELTRRQAAQLCWTTAEALEQKGYAAEAIHQYENARTQDPQVGPVARRLAVLYDLQGDPRRAEEEYVRAQQERPGDAELLNDLGYFHYRHDRLSAAETWLRNAVTVDPNCRRAWINLGQVLAKQGRLEESYQAFARVLQPAEAYSNLGVLLAKQGSTAEARTALQRAIELDPALKQPQAFLKALPSKALSPKPSMLPPGLTLTAPPSALPPRPSPPPAVVVAAPPPPPPPLLLPAAYQVPASDIPPTPPRPLPSPVVVLPPPLPTPPTPPRLPIAHEPPTHDIAPTPLAPLPIICTVHRPSAVAYVPPPPLPAIPQNRTPPLPPPTPPPAPLAVPSPPRISPPALAAPKPPSRPPAVVLTDCQGDKDASPP